MAELQQNYFFPKSREVDKLKVADVETLERYFRKNPQMQARMAFQLWRTDRKDACYEALGKCLTSHDDIKVFCNGVIEGAKIILNDHLPEETARFFATEALKIGSRAFKKIGINYEFDSGDDPIVLKDMVDDVIKFAKQQPNQEQI